MKGTRLKLEMTLQDVVVAMAQDNPGDGINPGAMACCVELINNGDAIDPDAAMGGGFAAIMHMDSMGIYGSRIYQLWNDVCGRDLTKMIAMLRADQLGQLAGVTETKILRAIANRGEGIDLDAVVVAVMERLPSFRPQVLAGDTAEN